LRNGRISKNIANQPDSNKYSREAPGGMRVLIVKLSALGDIIHALPVLDYLHKVSPGIEVDWVVEEPFLKILEGNPLLSRVHAVKTKVWRKQPFSAATRREVGEVIRALRERNYDMAFDIQGNIKSGIVTVLAGVKKRYGFDRQGVRELPNLVFTTNQVPLRRNDFQISARSLRVVSVPFGKDYQGMSLKSNVPTDPVDDSAAEAFLATLSDGLVFLFHPGTTWDTKLWHEPGWIELGKMIIERFSDATILLSSGNEQERLAVERICTGIGMHARPLPRISIKGFAAFLKKVDLVVGGDTGPVHMAAAVGTPTVSFYRATDARRNGPLGENHVAIQSPMHCHACMRKECDRDVVCRESIKADYIMKAIETILTA
jgi:heptosyltransferase-1